MHACWFGRPSNTTRQSKHTPITQQGPRGRPDTGVVRQATRVGGDQRSRHAVALERLDSPAVDRQLDHRCRALLYGLRQPSETWSRSEENAEKPGPRSPAAMPGANASACAAASVTPEWQVATNAPGAVSALLVDREAVRLITRSAAQVRVMRTSRSSGKVRCARSASVARIVEPVDVSNADLLVRIADQHRAFVGLAERAHRVVHETAHPLERDQLAALRPHRRLEPTCGASRALPRPAASTSPRTLENRCEPCLHPEALYPSRTIC